MTPLEVLEVAQNAPLTASSDAVATATTESTVMGVDSTLVTSAVVSDAVSAAPSDTGATASASSIASTSSAPPQAQALTSAGQVLHCKVLKSPQQTKSLQLWGLKV